MRWGARSQGMADVERGLFAVGGGGSECSRSWHSIRFPRLLRCAQDLDEVTYTSVHLLLDNGPRCGGLRHMFESASTFCTLAIAQLERLEHSVAAKLGETETLVRSEFKEMQVASALVCPCLCSLIRLM